MEGYHNIPASRVVELLKTDIHKGLDSREVRLRQTRQGYNDLDFKESTPSWRLLLRQFNSPLIYILVIAMIIALAKRDYADSLIIAIVVAVNATIGFFQEHKAERTMSKLRAILSPKARVVRDGFEQKIAARLLVAGDIIKVEAGDRVPADARIVESQNLRVNQASLTGESVPAMKRDGVVGEKTALIDRTNMIYSSTLVVNGTGYAVVSAIGMATELGKITKSIASVKEKAEGLVKKISFLSKILVVIAAFLAISTFAVGLWRGIEFGDMLQVVLSLLVSIVPEGLPIAVTVTLSVGLMRVYRKNAVIRKLSAAETLGAVTTICVDKTGTITEGKMMVEKLYLGGEEFEVTGEGYSLHGQFKLDSQTVDVSKSKILKLFAQSAALATTSTITKKDIQNAAARELTDPTETALAVVAGKANYFAYKLEEEYPEILEMPFDQERRYSCSVHLMNKKYRYVTKGAPEAIIALSSKYIDRSGEPKTLLTKNRNELLKQVNEYAQKGFRLTAIGYTDYPQHGEPKIENIKNITLIGLAAIADPVRSEVPDAIMSAKAAGIRVLMITGDHLMTAKAIAEKAGLLEHGRVLSAEEVERDDLATVSVIARATPNQKLEFVKWLQEKGEIVGMTGDGVNDAPALKRADVGIAMGRGGTDVALESSDMVLLRDEFSSIVAAIEQGRLIWENLRKVVVYLVSTGSAQMLLVLTALFLGFPLALTAVQVLWINLVTDGITSMALTVEPSERNLMKQKPQDPNEQIINKHILGRILLIASVMMIVSFFVFAYYLPRGYELAQTAAMATMTFFQLFHLLNSRSATQSVFKMPLLSNKLLMSLLALSFSITLLSIYFEPLQRLLGTVALPYGTLLTTLLLGVSVVVVDELRKLIVRKRI